MPRAVIDILRSIIDISRVELRLLVFARIFAELLRYVRKEMEVPSRARKLFRRAIHYRHRTDQIFFVLDHLYWLLRKVPMHLFRRSLVPRAIVVFDYDILRLATIVI